MTAYYETPKVAHVAVWRGSNAGWRSLCSRGVQMKGRTAMDRLRFMGFHGNNGLPVKPWCSSCVAGVRSLAADVLGDGS